MENLVTNLGKAGPIRLAIAFGIVAMVAAALFAITSRLGQEEKTLLFSGVSLEEAAAITEKLDGAKIAYELKGDGSSIFVPRSDAMTARMMIAEEGLLTRGSVGYEIFDKTDALGATQFVQDMNRLRALEGELARTIEALDTVDTARVHLVLPERKLFERSTSAATASIALRLSGKQLTSGQVRAVRNLVASAVPGLDASRVTILDEHGRLLASGAEGDAMAAGEGADERKAAIEERLRQVVLELVEGVVGVGNARVQVAAELDQNKVTQQSETYDPDGRVLRSSQTVQDTSSDRNNEGADPVSAAQNVPDAGQADPAQSGSESNNERTEETLNYEISKTTKTEIMDGGRMTRLSVAVAVDGVLTPNADPAQAPIWAARDQTELDRITQLVRTAVGFDAERGDTIEIVNVRFARDVIAPPEKPSFLDAFSKDDVMRGVEIGSLLLAALALVLFVLRPLVSGLFRDPVVKQIGPGGEMAAIAGGSGQMAGDHQSGEPESDLSIDLAKISGSVRASSIRQVAEVVDRHPDESVSIIRGWLNTGTS